VVYDLPDNSAAKVINKYGNNRDVDKGTPLGYGSRNIDGSVVDRFVDQGFLSIQKKAL
jgi:hypothetical protein